MKQVNVLGLLKAMKHSSVLNYALPGLTSYLIGGGKHGLVRIFESDRNIEEMITPHSHRYDFCAYVISGRVENYTYVRAQSRAAYNDPLANPYWVSFLQTKAAKGEEIIPGEYDHEEGYGPVSFIVDRQIYTEGCWYTVHHSDIHSIYFAKGTKVLVLEGPDVTNRTTILEPYANGGRVPNFHVAPWMFRNAKD